MTSNLPIGNERRNVVTRDSADAHYPNIDGLVIRDSNLGRSSDNKSDSFAPCFQSNKVSEFVPKDNNLFQNSLDTIRSEISNFNSFSDGWDGKGSSAPKKEVINDVLLFLNNWSDQSKLPEPELLFDGSIALQFYNENGNSMGGIDFCENHEGVYSILNLEEKFVTGYFNTNSTKETVLSIKKISSLLSIIDKC